MARRVSRYFGRNEAIRELKEALERLRREWRSEKRSVLVLGASGSGKSSLVRLTPDCSREYAECMTLDRARESLRAAELCAREGFINSAASRAYYAMFQAAQVAMEAAGFAGREWRHAGLQATFTSELIHRRKLYRAVFRDYLTAGLRIRNVADYSDAGVSSKMTRRCFTERLRCWRSLRRKRAVEPDPKKGDRRRLLDAKLVELALFAKELCPDAKVNMSTAHHEDEDGSVDVFPPPTLSEEEEDRLELTLAARAGEIFDETGLFILCAVFDEPAAG